MATIDVVPQESPGRLRQKRVVNDMSISGCDRERLRSQSSNTVLLRQHFPDGRPGLRQESLPIETLRTADLVHDPRQQRRLHRAQERDRSPGRDERGEPPRKTRSHWRREPPFCTTSPSPSINCANDLTFYSVPYDKLVAPVCPEAKLRKLVQNMIYVGVVAQLLEIDLAEVEKAIRKQFAKKVKARESQPGSSQGGLRLRRRKSHQT